MVGEKRVTCMDVLMVQTIKKSIWPEALPDVVLRCRIWLNETRSLWICQHTQIPRAKLGLRLDDDLGLLRAVANKDLLEAADFESRARFLKSWVTMPIRIQESFRGNIVH